VPQEGPRRGQGARRHLRGKPVQGTGRWPRDELTQLLTKVLVAKGEPTPSGQWPGVSGWVVCLGLVAKA
jgi:hypothetical protein